MRHQWKRIRYSLEWLGLILATKLVPWLPRGVCLRLARLVGFLMSIFDRHGRAVALSNLEVAFGEEFSPSQRREIMRESYRQFAQTMVDFLWSRRLTRQNFSHYIELQNVDEAVRAGGSERRILIACFHYSNFEWLSLACGYLGLTGTIVAHEFKNSSLDPIFKQLREQSGHQLVPRERGIMRLYRALRRKGRTALLVDLTVAPAQGAVVIECFGLKTCVTSAHAWLYERTGVPIVPAHCEPLSDSRYRLVFHRKIDSKDAMTHQQIAQACWDSFEPYVRKNPAPWLWMYKHWRYKPAGAARPYPFYANVAPRFEKLLRAESEAFAGQPKRTLTGAGRPPLPQREAG
jgi:KDO2-lipid IV(A) lauroyltransferase